MHTKQSNFSTTSLLSQPKTTLPSSKPALMVTWGVQEQFGGMTAMCLKRAGLFHDRGVPTAVVTFHANPSLDSIRSALEANGRLHPDVPLLNLHEYYAERTTSSQSSSIRVPPGKPEEWIESTRTYRTTDDSTLQIDYAFPGNEKLFRREFLRPDGTVYLVDTTSPGPHDPSQVSRTLRLLAEDGTVEFEFTSAARLYRHWLTDLVDRTKADLIIDSKFAAGFLISWSHPQALKFVNLHSTHVSVGQNSLTGRLSNAHSKLIDNRDLWDGITFLTESQRTAFLQRFGDSSNTVVISNPVDRPATLPAFESRDPSKVLHVGRFTKGKNIGAVIDIVNAVAGRNTPVHLHLIGDGDQRPALEEHVQRLGIECLVTFHGHVDDVPSHLASARVLILCSKFEGQSLAVLEAQAHGCVPVAYDVDFGPRDVIENERNGFLVRYEDEATAVNSVTTLLTDDELCSAMSKYGYETAQGFGSDQIFEQWQRALANARVNKKSRESLASIKARLAGFHLHADGDIDIEVEVQTGPAALTGLGLMAFERGTEPRHGKRVDPYLESDGVFSFRIPAELRPGFSGSGAVDINVVIEVTGMTRFIRLGATPKLRTVPYFTVYGNLSFK